jgi:crotonobetainyl-CoA:carnitine CoA-transferase CaiB-like acyl-CoA transferase
VDRWLSARTWVWSAPELAARLTSSGVAAAHVIHPRTITENAQLAHRGLFEVEEHPVTGRHLVPGLPFTMSRHPSWVRLASPTLGQDNDAVLAELGIDEDDRRELRALGVIGERPAGA